MHCIQLMLYVISLIVPRPKTSCCESNMDRGLKQEYTKKMNPNYDVVVGNLPTCQYHSIHTTQDKLYNNINPEYKV